MNSARIALIGNPNGGKTSLLNALTGSKLKVGNWPGVTVERKSGFYQGAERQIELVDLPGVYSLTSTQKNSIDECIACEFIADNEADLLINVVDAANLVQHVGNGFVRAAMRRPPKRGDTCRNRGKRVGSGAAG